MKHRQEILAFLLPLILTCLLSCEKRQKQIEDEPATEPMKYELNNPVNTIQLKWYSDTVVHIPVMLKYLSGSIEEVAVYIKSSPSWATPLIRETSMKVGKDGRLHIDFEPRDSGIFEIVLACKAPLSDTQY